MLGADATLLAMNINNAKRSQKTGWYTASVLFRDMSSYMYAAIQVFLIGITPLIIILMLVPGMGAKLGGSYMKAVVWLASWWPALHIVNFMMESYYTNSAETVYGIGDGAGLTMMNAGASAAFTDNMIIAIGFMATLVPTLMWGIINGTGMALTSMLDRASGAQYATSAAQDAAAGNFRAGNIGMNTYSANKYDSMQTRVTGRAAISENHAGTGLNQSTNQGGADVSLNNEKVSNKLSESQSSRVSEAWENAQREEEGLSNTLMTTATQAAGKVSQIGQNTSSGTNKEIKFGSQEEANALIQGSAALLTSLNAMDQDSIDKWTQQMLKFGVGMKAEAGPEGSSAKFVFDASYTAEGGKKESNKVAVTMTEDGSISFTNQNGEAMKLSAGKGSGETITATEVASQVDTYQKSDDYKTIQAQTNSYNTALGHAERVEETVAREQALSVQRNTNQEHVNNVFGGKIKVPTSLTAANGKFRVPTDNHLDEVGGKPSNQTIANTEAAIASDKQEAEGAFAEAKESQNKRRDKAIGNRISQLDEKNRDVIDKDLIGPANKGRNGHVFGTGHIYGNNKLEPQAPPEHLSKMGGFSIGGVGFLPVGMVDNKQGKGYDNVYRASNEQGDHEYYAYNRDEKALVKLEGLTGGNKGQVFFAGAQINQLDNYAIGELQKQDVVPTKENIHNFHASLADGNYGRGDSIIADAGSNIDFHTDYSFGKRVSSEEDRSSTDWRGERNEFRTYMMRNATTTYEEHDHPLYKK